MEGLKELCEDELRSALSPANLCDSALLAKRYRLDRLMDDCAQKVRPGGGSDWRKDDFSRWSQCLGLVKRRMRMALTRRSLKFVRCSLRSWICGFTLTVEV